MKGLLLKDLYMIKGFGKQYLLSFGFLVIWCIIIQNISVLSVYMIVLGGMMTISCMSLDETVQFNRYALTMPISARTLVQSKYILLLICMGAGTGLSMLTDSFSFLFPGVTEHAMGYEGIAATGILFLLSYAITMPIVFKIGVEKGRYVYLLGTIFVGMGAIAMFMAVPEKVWEGLGGFALTGGILAVSLFVVFVSYRISVKMIQNKEWD